MELVGDKVDGFGTVDQADAAAFEMAEHREREIVGLGARPAQDEVGPGQRMTLIMHRPAIDRRRDNVETMRFQDVQFDAARRRGLLKPQDFGDLRQGRIEIPLEEYPAQQRSAPSTYGRTHRLSAREYPVRAIVHAELSVNPLICRLD